MAMTNLYDSGLRRAQVHRVGDITEIVFDGAGAVATSTLDFKTVQRWAMSRMPSGNAMRDRGAVLGRLETCVVRRGTSIATTQGSNKPLLQLVKAMKQAGFNLSEWSLPPAVQAELSGAIEPAASDSEPDAELEAQPDEVHVDEGQASYSPPPPDPHHEKIRTKTRRKRRAVDALIKRLR